MNQDVYIFQRLNLGDIGLSDHLDSGIARCGDPDDPDQLDPDVTNLWQNMLQDVYPDEFESNPPDIHKWHRRFKLVVGEIASSGNVLLPLARHVASGMGLVYPLADEVDMQYIEDLETPEGTIHFDDLFDKAVQGVEYVWGLVASGVLAGDDEYLEKIGNWNLDTGRDEDDQLVFWEE
jgi:hypothetical protein